MHVIKCTFLAIALGCFAWGESSHAQESAPVPGAQVEMKLKAADEAEVGYLLYLPKKSKTSGQKKTGLMMFLHGRGESNGPLSLVAKWGPPMMAARGDDLPWVIVSPQCPKEDEWESDIQQKRIAELLDSVVENHNIDEKKIYLTGLSMGGCGCWRMAADHPNRFAAVAPICGVGDPADAEKLKDVRIWAFHGDQDSAAPFQNSVEMVTAIKAAGGNSIRFTSFEHIGHNCWSATYATPELYKWMAKQESPSQQK